MPEEITGKIKRKYMAHFIDASMTSTASFVRLGKDLQELTITTNLTVESNPNIIGETSVNVHTWAPTADVTPYYATIGDAVFDWLQDKIDNRKELDDLTTKVLEVHLWDAGATTGTFVAYMETVKVEIVSYGGDTTGYQIPFNIHYTGERVKGEFNPSTKAFTPDTPAG